MIHSLHGPPARRIAILEIPRSEKMRLGRIGTIRPEAVGQFGVDQFAGVYPTVRNDQAPSSAAQWMAAIVQRQSTARDTTPGTLSYTPTPATAPPANLASWTSWAGPCSAAGPATQQLSPALQPLTLQSAGKNRFWLYVAAGLGAAASAAYLYDSFNSSARK